MTDGFRSFGGGDPTAHSLRQQAFREANICRLVFELDDSRTYQSTVYYENVADLRFALICQQQGIVEFVHVTGETDILPLRRIVSVQVENPVSRFVCDAPQVAAWRILWNGPSVSEKWRTT